MEATKLSRESVYEGRKDVRPRHRPTLPPRIYPCYSFLLWFHLGFFSVVPSDKTMCPEVDSASESEYQGFLLG